MNLWREAMNARVAAALDAANEDMTMQDHAYMADDEWWWRTVGGVDSVAFARKEFRVFEPEDDVPQTQRAYTPPSHGDGWQFTPADALKLNDLIDNLVTDGDLVRVIAFAFVAIDLNDPSTFAAYENVLQAARDEQRRRREAK